MDGLSENCGWSAGKPGVKHEILVPCDLGGGFFFLQDYGDRDECLKTRVINWIPCQLDTTQDKQEDDLHTTLLSKSAL